ncbi:hypothetical protein KFL_007000010 [Klebsormidium nitens]|uniref:histidine kinase n=1 Tax=Klebsormidium nitens TaxID=105231 RepID=A0A1Y1IL91_KLENI|nr:hypothetical protein KFL_007000010 [Klebsormidium nitens]|eukprot:GAQ90902.1 hypothetical protein KFL_007000010 [Klebsormidium nitens]
MTRNEVSEFAGFRIGGEVHRTSHSVVFRALREDGNTWVVLKTVPAAVTSPAARARLHREYDITKDLQECPYIARPIEVVEYAGRTALVLEDLGATSLKAYVKGAKLSVHDVLKLGTCIASALEHLHKAGLIHQDVKPANVLVVDQLAAIKLTDFSISSRLTEESSMLVPSDVMKGTAAYISPEQTGRVNRAVDTRTDLYSLGVMLYELLTEHRPFRTEDLQQLLYQHIAVVPQPPTAVDPSVPLAVSHIVMKLLEKDAEARYQTAAGLRADLQTCLDMLAKGDLQPFPLGRLDHVGRLRAPDRILGRASEAAQLRASLARVASCRTLNVVLITGYSGIGKTALVEESVATSCGLGALARGKFDQYSRDTPFKAVTAAMQGLLKQVLGEPGGTVRRWRDQLQQALGTNGRLMTDVLPALGHLLGPQPEVPHTDATPAEARFLETFVRLIRCCAELRAPLVLFLDDLQWADLPSLRLLEALARYEPDFPLLLVGAYRHLEVDERHPLRRLKASLAQQESLQLVTLHLGPLTSDDTQALVAACVQQEGPSVAELAQVVHDKTEGNPFYELQFLQALVRENLLWFDKDTGECRWGDPEQLRAAAQVTTNVVDFMSNELCTRLPPNTRSVLSLAACLGDGFSLTALTLITHEPAKELVHKLRPALTAGFLLPVGEEYTERCDWDAATLSAVRFHFRHDRIREAAYEELGEADRAGVHLTVGRRLLAGLSAAQCEEHKFAILHHFNQALPLITDPAERLRLAHDNLAAGSKAKAATAYEAALQHVRCATELLGSSTDAWSRHPQLALEIQAEEAECLSLTGSNEEALKLLNELKDRFQGDATSTLRILELRIQALTLAGQLLQTLPDAAEGLATLGAPLPLTDPEIETAISAEQTHLEQALSRVGPADIAALPAMTSPRELAIVRLLDRLTMAAYCAGRVRLIHLVTLRMLALVLERGHSPVACLALPLYASFFLIRLKRYDQGHALGAAALRIMDRFADQTRRGQFNATLATAVAHWKGSLEECIALMEAGAASCLDHGDHVYAAFNLAFATLFEFHRGLPLPALRTRVGQAVKTLLRMKEKQQLGLALAMQQVIGILSGEVTTKPDAPFLQENAAHQLNLAAYSVVKAAALCHLQDFENALAVVEAVDPIREVLQPVVFSVLLVFYEAVACAQLLHAHSGDHPPQDRSAKVAHWERRLQSGVDALKEYAEVNPALHEHRYWLTFAEQQRWMRNDEAAGAAYEKAIAAAEEANFLQDVGLARALASRHCSAIKRPLAAAWHLSEAQDAYAAWGAPAAVQRLPAVASNQKPGRRQRSESPDQSTSQTTDATDTVTTNELVKASSLSRDSADMRAVLAASQTLSSEIVRGALVEKLLDIVMEVAGARYVVLVLQRPSGGGWFLEGSASVVGRYEEPSDDKRAATGLYSRSGAPEVLTKLAPVPLSAADALVPRALVLYVSRTQEVVMLNGASKSVTVKDSYLERRKPQSVLCMPIVRHGEVAGVLYVEHELLADAFPSNRIQTLSLLSAQIAISIENSAMYAEMRTREDELIIAKNLAEEATRAKSLFLATMSHEIRTPLNAIIGMTSFLLGTELPQEHQECVETIRQSSDQLLTLISDILDFSKIEARTLELEAAPFSLRQCLEEAADLVAAKAASKQLELATYTEASIPDVVMGDISRLRQVLVNLLSNAVKFTETGEVILQAKCIQSDKKAVTVQISCKDTGIGIEDNHLPRLFTAFSQADASTTRKFGGTGLGLAISDKLVKAMGGHFVVHSVPGVGATFSFAVRLETTQGMPTDEPNAPDRRVVQNKTCLIVARNHSLRSILEKQLTAWGVRCTSVADVDEAVNLLKKKTVVFDFGVADFSALDCATIADSTLVLEAPSLPLIVLNSWMELEAKNQDTKAHHITIGKPVKLTPLLDTVIKLVANDSTGNTSSKAVGISSINGALPQSLELDPKLRSMLKILIAEDNVVNQRVAILLLRRLGYTADCVADGLECIRALERQSYHVVLMDVQMPVLDGLQASRTICERWSREERPFLVAMTANAMQGDRDRCLAAGMVEYISKPVRIEELRRVLDAQAIVVGTRAKLHPTS